MREIIYKLGVRIKYANVFRVHCIKKKYKDIDCSFRH